MHIVSSGNLVHRSAKIRELFAVGETPRQTSPQSLGGLNSLCNFTSVPQNELQETELRNAIHAAGGQKTTPAPVRAPFV
jgi:hypothetical protein